MEVYDFRWGRPDRKKFKITFSKQELLDFAKSLLIISAAFSIANVGFGFSIEFFLFFIISALTVGIGFIAHELGHKIVAQKYGCVAHFMAFNHMLLMTLLFSFAGFVFIAPGAVMISGNVNRKRNGKISAAGPGVNLVLAAIFYILSYIFPIGLFRYGFKINTWLGLFNMIPFGNIDGIKILFWNKKVYFLMAAVAVIFMVL